MIPTPSDRAGRNASFDQLLELFELHAVDRPEALRERLRLQRFGLSRSSDGLRSMRPSRISR